MQAEEEILKEQQYIYTDKRYSDRQNIQNAGEKNLIIEIIKQLKIGTELYTISVPPFILDSVSLLERLSEYTTPNNLLCG